MNKGDLQRLMEIGLSTISRIERNKPIKIKILDGICGKLDCNIKDIIEDKRGCGDV